MIKRIIILNMTFCVILLLVPTIPAVEYTNIKDSTESFIIQILKNNEIDKFHQIFQNYSNEFEKKDLSSIEKILINSFTYSNIKLKNVLNNKFIFKDNINDDSIVELLNSLINKYKFSFYSKIKERSSIQIDFFRTLVMIFAIACITAGVLMIYFGSGENTLIGSTLIIIGLIIGFVSLLSFIGES